MRVKSKGPFGPQIRSSDERSVVCIQKLHGAPHDEIFSTITKTKKLQSSSLKLYCIRITETCNERRQNARKSKCSSTETHLLYLFHHTCPHPCHDLPCSTTSHAHLKQEISDFPFPRQAWSNAVCNCAPRRNRNREEADSANLRREGSDGSKASMVKVHNFRSENKLK